MADHFNKFCEEHNAIKTRETYDDHYIFECPICQNGHTIRSLKECLTNTALMMAEHSKGLLSLVMAEEKWLLMNGALLDSYAYWCENNGKALRCAAKQVNERQSEKELRNETVKR